MKKVFGLLLNTAAQPTTRTTLSSLIDVKTVCAMTILLVFALLSFTSSNDQLFLAGADVVRAGSHTITSNVAAHRGSQGGDMTLSELTGIYLSSTLHHCLSPPRCLVFTRGPVDRVNPPPPAPAPAPALARAFAPPPPSLLPPPPPSLLLLPPPPPPPPPPLSLPLPTFP